METLVASWAEYASVPFAEDGVITFKYSDNLTNGLRDDIAWSMERISEVLPIEFREVSETGNAEWKLRWLPTNSNWAGYASGNSYSGWEISFNRWDYADDFDRHLVLHEFGHALGLEHPFDSRDGDVWEGADVQDTVMAYQTSSKGFRIDFSKADWDALTGLYGGISPTPLEPVKEEPPVVVAPPEEEEEPKPVKEVERDGPFNWKKKKWERFQQKFERMHENGNTEKAIKVLYRKGLFDGYSLDRINKRTFTLQEENVIMNHVRNEDWEAITQTRFFTRHDPTATNCPCCTK